MKKEKYGFFVLALLLIVFLPLLSYSQSSHEMLLTPPSAGNVVYVNAQILADTNANGSRKDPDRVYVLQRGAEYLANAIIKNTGWILRIKAKDGAGKKPIVYLAPAVNSTRPPGAFIQAAGNLYLTNIAISGIIESDPTLDTTNYIGGMQGALITAEAAGVSIYIDSCQLTNTNGNHVRTNSAPITVKITNSLFTDMGYLGTSNLGAGKAVDLRNGSCDSLIMINNTFINWQDRIVRHYQSSAPIRYLNFDHNTLVNGMSYFGLLSLGKTQGKIYITNNLLIDPYSLGEDTCAIRQAEYSDSGEKDAYGLNRMTWVLSVPNKDTTTFKISNNYYSISTEGQKFLTDNKLKEGSPLTWNINSRLGADSTKAFTKISLTMPKVPPLMLSMMNWYRSPALNDRQTTPKNWSAAYDYNRRTIKYYRDTMNCAYVTTSAAYTAALGGFPVGDLNWFPSRKPAWEQFITSVQKIDNGVIPVQYSLDQNYPNPFNPSTTINYNLPKNASVSLKIFNALGQEVVTLVNGEEQMSGKYQVIWDGKDSFGKTMATGMYFYELKAGNVNLVKKMLLMK
jgi:hypothetical protein